jgi:hypothetical protein
LAGRTPRHDLTVSIDLDDWLWIQANKDLYNASDDIRQHIKLIRSEVEATAHRFSLGLPNSKQAERSKTE